MPNTSFTRPAGILCSGTAYNNKKNPYEKLKEFLYEQGTGRTDVVFFASAASGLEPNQWTYSQETYHYVGGLIDGFAKGVLLGNPNTSRPSRKLYGTPIKFGYECGTIPNFDPWNNTTWFNPNTTGAGNFITGTSTAYNNYFYYRHNTNTPTIANSNTGCHLLSAPNPGTNTFYQFQPDIGELALPWLDLWYSAFNNGFDVDNESPPPVSASSETKGNYNIAKALRFSAQPDTTRGNPNSTTTAFAFTVTQTPEQPQRFWFFDHPWYIPNAVENRIPIGIGYLDTSTDTISELFTDAVNYGYTTGLGLSVGTPRSTVIANPNLKCLYYDTNTFDFRNDQNNQTANTVMWGGKDSTLRPKSDFDPYYREELQNKKLIIRNVSFAEIITIRNLNFKPTPPVNEVEFRDYDGFQVTGTNLDGPVFFRWAFANTDTQSIPSTLNTKVFKKWGLATLSDDSVSSKQAGLPYIFMWGIRTSIPSISAWQLFDFGTPRVTVVSSYPFEAQLLGFPRSLSTLAPAGFFFLTQEDTSKMVAANTTIDKSRCMTIRPDLGLFHNGYSTNTPLTRALTTIEKDNILGIFKSANFKYCVTAYTLDKFSDETTFEGANIVVTGHHKDKLGGALTAIQTATNIVLPQAIKSKVAGDSRLFTRTVTETTFNLNALNSGWTRGELRFGFLGLGSATNTKGNLLVTTHYGVDSAATDGISFHHADLNYRYRSGDVAYQNKTIGGSSGRSVLWLELFKSIADRQTQTSLGGTPGNSKKLVLMFEIGIWELANPNATYNGFNSWQYFTDPLTGAASTLSGRANTSAFENNTLTYVINAALLAGFSREEIVVAFYTPAYLTRTNVQSEGTLQGFSLNSSLDVAVYVGSKDQRSQGLRAAEIFKNNFLDGRGYFNPQPAPPFALYSATNPAAQRALHINFGQVPTITAKLSIITEAEGTEWYHFRDSEDGPFYNNFSEKGALAVGFELADYLNTTVSTTIFVPGWITPFGDLLGETVDPVLGIDLGLLVPTGNASDFGPYLLDLKDFASAGNNLCREYISAYKHKTLQ